MSYRKMPYRTIMTIMSYRKMFSAISSTIFFSKKNKKVLAANSSSDSVALFYVS